MKLKAVVKYAPNARIALTNIEHLTPAMEGIGWK